MDAREMDRSPAGKEAAAMAMQAPPEKKREGCCSSSPSVEVGKDAQLQKGPPETAGRGTQAPEAVHSGSEGASLRSVGVQHEVKEEPPEEPAQLWETQWQDFLSRVEVSPSPTQEPHLPQESSPWNDAAAFLASFEQVAEACRWPREEWVARLLPALTGEAELVFSSLEAGDREHYGKVKAAILQEDAVHRERSRQHFRSLCYQEAEGPRGACGRLRELCSQWLKVDKQSKEQILEELILEQFLTILPSEIQSWVKEHRVESSTQAVCLAEEFLRSQWVPGVKEEQTDQLQGERSERLPERAATPLNAEEELQLGKESKMEDLTDFSDAELSADGGEGCEEDDWNPGAGFDPAFLQSIFSEQLRENSPQICDQEEGGRKERLPENSVAESGPALVPQRPCKEPRIHYCSLCGKSFTRKYTLTQHKKTVHPSEVSENPSQGFIARYGGRNKTSLERPQRAPSGEDPCVCSRCGETFSSRTQLVVHQRTHVGEELPQSLPEVTVYICGECGDTFGSIEDHDAHQGTHTADSSRAHGEGGGKTEPRSGLAKPPPAAAERPYKCSECDKCFMSMSVYRRHQVFHGGRKALSLARKPLPKTKTCPVCRKRFANARKLQLHRRVHKRVKPGEQGQRRTGGWVLRNRENSREKEGPGPLRQRAPRVPAGNFPCSRCGRNFYWHSLFVRHQLTSTCAKRNKGVVSTKSFVPRRSIRGRPRRGRPRKNRRGRKLAPVLSNRPASPAKSSPCSKCGKSFPSPAALAVHRCTRTRERRHACPHCDKTFIWSSSLCHHKKIAHGALKLASLSDRAAKSTGKSSPCPECGKIYSSYSSLLRHQRMHSGEKIYHCKDCGKSFLWDSTYYVHRRKAHPQAAMQTNSPSKPKTFACGKCGMKFRGPASLWRHQCLQAKTKPYKCDDCGMGYLHAVSLSRHKKDHQKKKIPDALQERASHLKEKNCVCSECGRGFPHFRHLKLHQRVHLREKPFKCEDCGKSFMWDSSYYVHRRKAHPQAAPQPNSPAKPKTYSCGQCGMKFKGPASLRRHQCLQAISKPYKCDDCGKGYLHAVSLSRHKKDHQKKKIPDALQERASHLKENNCICSECGRGFPHFGHLKLHQRVHLREKPFKCGECGQRFMWQVFLDRHRMRHHLGDKSVPLRRGIPHGRKRAHSYRASAKSFVKKQDLLARQPIRIAEAPYKCTECGKSFRLRSSFEGHRKTHEKTQENLPEQTVTGQKAKVHRCLECGLSFDNALDLQSHRYTHRRGKFHKCTDCGRNFSQRSSMSRHRREIHKGKQLVPVLQRIPDPIEKPCRSSDYEGRPCKPLDLLTSTPRGGEPETCSERGERFNCQLSLQRHQIIHVRMERYTCRECGQSFLCEESLAEHKRTHNGFQTFTMQFCQSRLLSEAVSRPHKRSGDAPTPSEVGAGDCTAPIGGPPLEFPNNTAPCLASPAGAGIGEPPLEFPNHTDTCLTSHAGTCL